MKKNRLKGKHKTVIINCGEYTWSAMNLPVTRRLRPDGIHNAIELYVESIINMEGDRYICLIT